MFEINSELNSKFSAEGSFKKQKWINFFDQSS